MSTFKVRLSPDPITDEAAKKQTLAMKKMDALLKKERMELTHTDPEGFMVYEQRAKGARKVASRRPSAEKRAEVLEKALCFLLRYAVGNGSGREGNPYGKVEVEEAMKALLKVRGIKWTGKSGWLDAKF